MTFPQHKLLPQNILDVSSVDDGAGDESSNEEEEQPEEQPVERPSNPFNCKICFDATVEIFFEPCKHMAVCESCWEIMRDNFKQLYGINHEEMDAAMANDPTLQLPEDLFPKCPHCRQTVKGYKKVYF